MGGDRYADPVGAQRFELGQVVGDRALPEPWAPAAQIAGIDADEGDPGRGCGGRGCPRLLEAEIVELPDGGETVRPELAVDLDILLLDLRSCDRFREGDHAVAPGPEVPTGLAAPQGALKGMTMGVDEAGNGEGGHGRILSA